jgi:hypothetical protein
MENNNTTWRNDKEEEVTFAPGYIMEPDNDRDLYATVDTVAELGWECHRAWEKIIGEAPRPAWDDLSEFAKDRLRASVKWLAQHPTSSVSAQHDAWRADNFDTGNPNLVPFDELPYPQQMKARLWRYIIFALMG